MSRKIEPNAAVGMEAKCKEKDPLEKHEDNSKKTTEEEVLLPPTATSITRCNDDVNRENTIVVNASPVDKYPNESDTVVQQQHHDLWQHPGMELEESNSLKKKKMFGKSTISSRPKFRSSMPMPPKKKAFHISSDNLTFSAMSKEKTAPTTEVPPRKTKHECEDVQKPLELEENRRKREIRLERNRKTAKARREKKHAETEEKQQKITKIVLENDSLRQSIRSRYQELSDAGVNEDTMKRAISPPFAMKQMMETKIQERHDLLGVVQDNEKDGMLALPLPLYNMSGRSFLDATCPPVYSPPLKAVSGKRKPRQTLLRPEETSSQQHPFISIDNHKQSMQAQQLLGTDLQQQKERQPHHKSHLVRDQKPHYSPPAASQSFEPYYGQDHQRPDNGAFPIRQKQTRHQHEIEALGRSHRQKIENNNDKKKRLEGRCDETRLLQGFGQQEQGSNLQYPTTFHGLKLEQNSKQLGEHNPNVGGNKICVTDQSQEVIEQDMNRNILQQEQSIFDSLRQSQQHEWWFQRQMQREDVGLRNQIDHQDPLRFQEHLRYGGDSAQNLRHGTNIQININEVDRSSILNAAGTASPIMRRQEELQGQQQWVTSYTRKHGQQRAQEQLQEKRPENNMVLQRQGHPISENDRIRIERVEMPPVLNRPLLPASESRMLEGRCYDSQEQDPCKSNLNSHQNPDRQQDQHQLDVDQCWSDIERQQLRDFFQQQIEELDREEEED